MANLEAKNTVKQGKNAQRTNGAHLTRVRPLPLQRTLKEGCAGGMGRSEEGRLRTGNRTVTQCWVRSCHFVFVCLVRSFVVFFTVLLFLGSLFEKNFRERTFSLALVFSSTSRFFLFKRESSGSHPTRPLCSCPFFCLCPLPRRVYLPFWPCVLSFSRSVGVAFWAPGVLAFFWILRIGAWGA